MPAVTVENPLTLPRVPRRPTPGRARCSAVTTAPSGFEGEGFPVRRAFAGHRLPAPRPVHHDGPDGRGGVRAGRAQGHPLAPAPRLRDRHLHHRRHFIHQDSHGGGGTITNGDTQWMTAGSGLLHIETPPESLVVSGGLFHGLQLWVNLPPGDKMMPPALPGHPRPATSAAHLRRRRRAAAA